MGDYDAYKWIIKNTNSTRKEKEEWMNFCDKRINVENLTYDSNIRKAKEKITIDEARATASEQELKDFYSGKIGPEDLEYNLWEAIEAMLQPKIIEKIRNLRKEYLKINDPQRLKVMETEEAEIEASKSEYQKSLDARMQMKKSQEEEWDRYIDGVRGSRLGAPVSVMQIKDLVHPLNVQRAQELIDEEKAEKDIVG